MRRSRRSSAPVRRCLRGRCGLRRRALPVRARCRFRLWTKMRSTASIARGAVSTSPPPAPVENAVWYMLPHKTLEGVSSFDAEIRKKPDKSGFFLRHVVFPTGALSNAVERGYLASRHFAPAALNASTPWAGYTLSAVPPCRPASAVALSGARACPRQRPSASASGRSRSPGDP